MGEGRGSKAQKNRVVTTLEELGLSSYEAQAYLAALRHSPLTGYQLSKVSGVPRSRIYDTIEKLVAKGLVVSQPGEKNLLSALDYRTFLDQKEKESASTIDFLRGELSAIRTPEPSGIWTITGRARILELAVDLIRQARSYVYLVAGENDLKPLVRDLSEERKKKVPIFGVFCGEGEIEFSGMVRHFGPSCSKGCEIAMVVDGNRALIGCTQPEDTGSAALTQNSGVVSITEQYIKHEVFLNTLYASKDRAQIKSYIRQYDRTMKKLP